MRFNMKFLTIVLLLAIALNLNSYKGVCSNLACDGVQWQKRCFVAIIQPYGVNYSGPLTYNEASALCDAKGGGYPANIYDRQHLEVSMIYLRTKIPDDEFNIIVWLGLSFDPVGVMLSFYDGNRTTFALWSMGAPNIGKSYKEWTRMVLDVGKYPSDGLQGMFNDLPLYDHDGVYCEVDQCEGFRWNKICFWAKITAPDYKISYTNASNICKENGGYAANIYDKFHYNVTRNYVRNLIPVEWRSIDVWIGMTFSTASGVLYFNNGERARFSDWHPGFPIVDNLFSEYTQMVIDVERNPEGDRQGMYHFPPTSTWYGIICESRG